MVSADPEGGTANTAGPQVPTRIFASPLARKMANDDGLTIEQITGTGPRGRIMRMDVEAALHAPAVPVTPADPPVQAAAPRAASGGSSSACAIPGWEMASRLLVLCGEGRGPGPLNKPLCCRNRFPLVSLCSRNLGQDKSMPTSAVLQPYARHGPRTGHPTVGCVMFRLFSGASPPGCGAASVT